MQTVYRWLTRIGIATSHPLALAAVVVFVVLWLMFDRRSFDWQAAATVATLFMTVFIQRAERRDTQAIHAKLDELLRAEGQARSELTTLDEREPEEIIEHRDEERARSSDR
jgi:low affinity Fe/Cu permease